ncbi:hypothetical protein Goshw_006281 [Gossypium schwendimanii]|uniref:Uncharacterized protein n=1 Tax=Gossypium schwendimanii TaxID=34291 RepID=A0A7J9KJX4_GOSSC|nr:hypothetical protein [Gossypium schwendimanii]
MAPTSASGDQPSDKDNWDNGRLARRQQLLTEIVLRNKLTTLVFDGDTTCVGFWSRYFFVLMGFKLKVSTTVGMQLPHCLWCQIQSHHHQKDSPYHVWP